MTSKYEFVIWLEIHVKLNSPNKLFCRCKNEQDFDELSPNTNICPVCTAQPWALPVLNKEPLEKAILLGYALKCKISEFSKFDRKSYFYPDLPSGFQITQLPLPTNWNGEVSFYINNYETPKTVRIERAHIENDAWKTIHDGWKWILDFNRAWTPLVEIVTYPDFMSVEEVTEFLKELQRNVRANWIGYADLEKWQMRCDVNLSTREIGATKLWIKVELKNLNSFSAIKRAIEHEFKRQIEIIDSWKQVDQETRGWNDDKWDSYSMRSKEDSLDYRYFPEPDLPTIKVDNAFLEPIKNNLVESSFEKITRYKTQYEFNKEYINALINNLEINEWFESSVKAWIDAKVAARWIVSYITRFLDNVPSISEFKFSKQDFIDFLKLIQDWNLMESHAKQVIVEMFETGKSACAVIEEKWFKPVDSSEIEWFVKEVINENPKPVEDFKAWEMKAIGFLVGQVIKKSWWKADPKVVKELLEKNM